MSKKDKRSPKVACNPPDRQIRFKETPGSTDELTPAWQFHGCDEDHNLWGWGKLTAEDRLSIIKKHLYSFETMTWGAIKQQSGGKAKGRGTNHHALPVEEFVKGARKRLEDLKLDDIDELFSLRLGNTVRLYGVKDGRVLRFIWHDPHHGSRDEAYPTKK